MDSKSQSFASRIAINSVLFYLVVYLYAPEYLLTLHGLLDTVIAFLIIGVIFSVLNAIIKPIITLMTLPLVFTSLGLFMLVINGLIISLTAAFIPNLSLSLGESIIGGIVMSIANYLITNLFDRKEV